MINKRYLSQYIIDDLSNKMVFIGGPRQVGKTTLVQHLGQSVYPDYQYLNWDRQSQRQAIRAERFEASAKLLIFDELHKYRQWKNYVKGIYDTQKEQYHILVTGSARLDLYKKGGDSLMGRYHYYRLHPFSVAELLQHQVLPEPFTELQFVHYPTAPALFTDLLKFSGFPEPFFAKQPRTLRRWQNTRLDRLIKEDVRDIESIRDLSALQVLAELLPQRVGSQLSLNALREDLGVAHKTVALWMEVLERFYYHYRIYPFMQRGFAALKKEPKLYLWDWTPVTEPGARFENIIASHLLKFVHGLHDILGHKAVLWYIRDISGREVDFLVTVNNQPWFAVEAKLSDRTPSKPLRYFQDKLHIPYVYQVVAETGIDERVKNIRVLSADLFCTALL
ncbi:MAG: ATP-binding protein [Patescibacteria group bacterium]